MNIRKQFIITVKEYVDLIEKFPQYSLQDFLRKCAKLLPQIYTLGQELPEVELPNEASDEIAIKEVISPREALEKFFGKHDHYKEIFDPIFDEDIVEASLSDDLTDIYLDLKRPLLKYEMGNNNLKEIALWEWKFNIQGHCGDHLVDALRPIHRLAFNQLHGKM
jgi:hypothetical protein